ncbi:MAG: serine/threonine kinase [uncultured Sulfurovum sp.]|uniref:Serine/threonine kinase n=1 Tax=uncultured Sulfurovum sp. TaxID=269237 RepID=A0A6S6SVY8_9BACT|nr:MAG: serine/threonine kinase [uncultured Sulfurovum sp.]
MMTTNFVPIKSDKFDFYISKYQVTMQEYLAFAKETHSHYPEWIQEDHNCNLETGSDDLYEEVNFEDDAPVVGVSWEDAQAYCVWLSQKESKNYRLPTEAEWQYACKAGTSSPYSCDEDEVARHAWYFENALGEAHTVGSKKPNPWGLYDMNGNVWEWCQDTWSESYDETATTEAFSNANDDRRVLRGGSWFDSKENASSTARHKYALDFCYVDVGFRVLYEKA